MSRTVFAGPLTFSGPGHDDPTLPDATLPMPGVTFTEAEVMSAQVVLTDANTPGLPPQVTLGGLRSRDADVRAGLWRDEAGSYGPPSQWWVKGTSREPVAAQCRVRVEVADAP